jgi:hypothetical protein
VTATNIAAAIIAIRIIFFIACAPKGVWSSIVVRTSIAYLSTNTTGKRHQRRARQGPRNDKLRGRNSLVAAL